MWKRCESDFHNITFELSSDLLLGSAPSVGHHSKHREVCTGPRRSADWVALGLGKPAHGTRVFLLKPVDAAKDAVNTLTSGFNHVRARYTLLSDIRSLGHEVWICAEMNCQIEMALAVLLQSPPEDVKSRVVWRDACWPPDEAASEARKEFRVSSLECHSPLSALNQGTPAF